jgi:hypothetical protein
VSRAGFADAFLYEPEAIDVGVLLFGARVCLGCGRKLPACTDYFTATNGAGKAMKPHCKPCLAAKYRDAGRERARRRAERVQAERLVHDLCLRTARMLGAVAS